MTFTAAETARFEAWMRNCNRTRRISGERPMSREEAFAKWIAT